MVIYYLDLFFYSYLQIILNNKNYYYEFLEINMGIGDWGLGIGD